MDAKEKWVAQFMRRSEVFDGGTPRRHVAERVHALVGHEELKWVVGDTQTVAADQMSGVLGAFTDSLLVLVTLKDVATAGAGGGSDHQGETSMKVISRRALRSLDLIEDPVEEINGGSTWAVRHQGTWPQKGVVRAHYEGLQDPIRLAPGQDYKNEFPEFLESVVQDLTR